MNGELMLNAPDPFWVINGFVPDNWKPAALVLLMISATVALLLSSSPLSSHRFWAASTVDVYAVPPVPPNCKMSVIFDPLGAIPPIQLVPVLQLPLLVSSQTNVSA